MRLADPLALWLLLPLGTGALAAVLYAGWARRRALARLGEAAALAPLLAEVSLARRRLRAALQLVALLALGLAAARPQWGSHTELARHRGLDVIFALDVARSMLARDVKPDRLQRAKLELAALSEQLAGNRIGLIAFAGTAFVQCPLTTDVSAFKMFLNTLRPEVVPQGGTALARALSVAGRLVRGSQEKASPEGRRHAQVLVLLTDGEDHEGQVAEAAAQLKELGVQSFVVGVGSETGEPIPELDAEGHVSGYLKDRAGKPVVTRLDRQTLEALATALGGAVYQGSQLQDHLAEVAREIDKLQKSEFESRLLVQYRERFQWPLGLALLALLLAAAVRERGARGAA